MAFDMKKFTGAQWTPRTREVPAPELAPWFGADEAPQVTVRSLSGDELARANEAASQAQSGKMEAVIAALSRGSAELEEALREVLGTAGRVPADHVRRLELLQLGCVAPTFDLRGAHALAKHLPTVFLQLTTAILELTGMGAEPGKRAGSGKTAGSEPQ